MDTLSRYKIDFRDLSDEPTAFTWELRDSFFSALDVQDIQHGELTATLRVNKKAAGFRLFIHATGTIQIPCDRCLEPMTQPIDAEDSIEVRLGDTFDDDGERIIIPEDDPVLDVSWNLYETIALAIPIFHVHPEGECPEEVSQYLVADDEPGGSDSEGATDNQPADSRWDALRSLLGDSEHTNSQS